MTSDISQTIQSDDKTAHLSANHQGRSQSDDKTANVSVKHQGRSQSDDKTVQLVVNQTPGQIPE